MNHERRPVPLLNKSDTAVASPEARARALELACRAAAQILASREHIDDTQEPVPASSIRLLRRLARGGG